MQNYPSVTKFMAKKLITFAPDTDIQEAAATMLRHKISGAPVVNSNNEMVGILSEVDCLKLLVEPSYNKEPAKPGLVSEFMSKEVTTISSDKTILDAAYMFVHFGLKRLPVMEKGRLIGQISRRDVMKAIFRKRPQVKHVPDSWKNRMPFSKKIHKVDY